MSNAFNLAKAEFEIEMMTREIHRLAEENQTLDWEIPSQYDLLLRNTDTMDYIESKLRALQAQVEPKETRSSRELICDPEYVAKLLATPFDPTPYARAAVKKHFDSLPAVTIAEKAVQRPKLQTSPRKAFSPVRRGHLTLIHSKD